jgi:hypothetical protein
MYRPPRITLEELVRVLVESAVLTEAEPLPQEEAPEPEALDDAPPGDEGLGDEGDDLGTDLDPSSPGGPPGDLGDPGDLDMDMDSGPPLGGGGGFGGGFSGGGGGFSGGGFDDDEDMGLETGDEDEEEVASTIGPEDVEIPDDPVTAIVDLAIKELGEHPSPGPILRTIKSNIQRWYENPDDAAPVIDALWNTEDLVLRDVARRLLLFIRGEA